MITRLTTFVDTRDRRWEAIWGFDAASPVEVDLVLLSPRGDEATWTVDRSAVLSSDRGRGDVVFDQSGDRLVVVLYPMTTRSLTLVGSLPVAVEFLAACEELVPSCAGCDEAGCVSCRTVERELETELAWTLGEAA